MRLLPALTALPTAPLAPRHQPRAAAYAHYRQCLRWDFGFHCVFCLLHERDFMPTGGEGFAVFWIKHREPQSRQAALKNAYDNCLWACRLCNHARGATAVKDGAGRRLLDPRTDAWAARFEIQGHSLEVKAAGDGDAEYTHLAYDLADARKTTMRRRRATRVPLLIRAVRQHLADEAALLERAKSVRGVKQRACVLEAENARRLADFALSDLQDCAAVLPADAVPCSCRRHGALPAWLDTQLRDDAAALGHTGPSA